jgi:hypothetical protein
MNPKDRGSTPSVSDGYGANPFFFAGNVMNGQEMKISIVMREGLS